MPWLVLTGKWPVWGCQAELGERDPSPAVMAGLSAHPVGTRAVGVGGIGVSQSSYPAQSPLHPGPWL